VTKFSAVPKSEGVVAAAKAREAHSHFMLPWQTISCYFTAAVAPRSRVLPAMQAYGISTSGLSRDGQRPDPVGAA
jgi:hypothetical protein